MPTQQVAIDGDYEGALRLLPDGLAKTGGIAVGEQAAEAIVASCANDGAVAPNTYRPHAAAERTCRRSFPPSLTGSASVRTLAILPSLG
jgi:hypothetical protein